MAAAKATKNSIICYFGPLLRFGKTETQGYGAFSRRRIGENTVDALLEREITAAQRWRILTDLMDEFEWVHGRPLRTFEEFRAWLATASGRRAMRRKMGTSRLAVIVLIRLIRTPHAARGLTAELFSTYFSKRRLWICGSESVLNRCDFDLI